jgi:hypothetical protein
MSLLDDLLGKHIRNNGGALVPDRKTINIIGATVTDNTATGETDLTILNGGPAPVTALVDQAPTVGLSGTVYNNVGASGQVVINLPASPTVGTRFSVRVADTQYMKFLANTGQTIQLDSGVSAAAGFIRSNYSGASITVEAVSATRWFAHSDRGPWDIDT